MAETFTGALVWITMCGNIDVRHPDGRMVRAYGSSREHDAKARALGKRALVTVKMPDANPGGGAFDPRVLSIEEDTSTEPTCSGLGVHPGQQTQQNPAEKNGQSVSCDPHGHSPLSVCDQAFCAEEIEVSSAPLDPARLDNGATE